ncbi:hypothetical protein AcW1_001367 [Taiwanofungus camphoratus]|nr:hypothetical protein AcW2_000102 [Antrodia cinnamomea]KAI0937367.1 hypothetical protein AcV5_005294 [Antrodia cinnamomea]KAI0962577.1 hypothetical protein AcV7_001392 [Antrodia cinnamomea]KAI0964578.1 hypothetical protein AcW1_001367 [Antrodia cinnamomea]
MPSQKATDPVEEPEVEDDESDEYDDIDDVEEGGEGIEYEEEEDEGDEEGAGPSGQRSNLTALLLGGQDDIANGEEEEEEEDEEYSEEPDEDGVPSAAPSVTGIKRGREDASSAGGEIQGDYGESEENSDIVTKKARTSGEEA